MRLEVQVLAQGARKPCVSILVPFRNCGVHSCTACTGCQKTNLMRYLRVLAYVVIAVQEQKNRPTILGSEIQVSNAENKVRSPHGAGGLFEESICINGAAHLSGSSGTNRSAAMVNFTYTVQLKDNEQPKP